MILAQQIRDKYNEKNASFAFSATSLSGYHHEVAKQKFDFSKHEVQGFLGQMIKKTLRPIAQMIQ
jgi:hypothetical protein